MPVTNVAHDIDNLTLTINAEFAAPVERLWELYGDPRQIEKVFGPPSHPATFVEHELKPGARSKYFMTSPEGQKYYGIWDITAVDKYKSFMFDDASLTSTSTRTPTCRSRRTPTHSRTPAAQPRLCSPAHMRAPRHFRRCSTWGSLRAPVLPSTRSEPPQLNWSTAMVRKRRTRNGEQATQARGDRHQAAAG